MDKRTKETSFWRTEKERYKQWYNGTLNKLHGTSSPAVKFTSATTLDHNAIITWWEHFQKPHYLDQLRADSDMFDGKVVLDIGSGPMPSAACFSKATILCLEPALDDYLYLGFPLHYYPYNVTWVHGCAEDIPLQDNSVDAVISVNAIDHVDDFKSTVKEIQRVLKPDGDIRLCCHYHKAKTCEPIALSDQKMSKAFHWCDGMKKIEKIRNDKFVWSNMK